MQTPINSRMQTMATMLMGGQNDLGVPPAIQAQRQQQTAARQMAQSGKGRGPDGLNKMQQQLIAQRLLQA